MAIRARRAAAAVGREAATEVDRLRYARRGRADLALFHDFAPSADRRRPPVSPGVARRVSAPGPRGRGQSNIGGDDGVSLQLFQLRLPPAPPVRTRRRALRPSRRRPDRDLPRVRRRNRPEDRPDQPTARRRDDRPVSVQPRSASRSRDRARRTPSQSSTRSIRACFIPPPTRDPIAGRRVRVIATSWSDNPNKGADALAWLDANLDHERFELTFAGRTQSVVRAHPVAGRDSDRRGRGRAAAERRLPRTEPQRSVLERAARGTRERAAGRLSRERRPPRARRRRGDSVRRAG